MTKTSSEIHLFRNDMKFSAAHFTIFNAKERERLHGHNYYVSSKILANYIEPGITYDYTQTRKKILALCRSLNEYLLLPRNSPYLKIIQNDLFYEVTFGEDKMFFLQKETLVLDVCNVTSEELARWFVERLMEDKEDLKIKSIQRIAISVSTTKGQSSTYSKGIV